MPFRDDMRQREGCRKKEMEEKEEPDLNHQHYTEAGTENANTSP